MLETVLRLCALENDDDARTMALSIVRGGLPALQSLLIDGQEENPVAVWGIAHLLAGELIAVRGRIVGADEGIQAASIRLSAASSEAKAASLRQIGTTILLPFLRRAAPVLTQSNSNTNNNNDNTNGDNGNDDTTY